MLKFRLIQIKNQRNTFKKKKKKKYIYIYIRTECCYSIQQTELSFFTSVLAGDHVAAHSSAVTGSTQLRKRNVPYTAQHRLV